MVIRKCRKNSMSIIRKKKIIWLCPIHDQIHLHLKMMNLIVLFSLWFRKVCLCWINSLVVIAIIIKCLIIIERKFHQSPPQPFFKIQNEQLSLSNTFNFLHSLLHLVDHIDRWGDVRKATGYLLEFNESNVSSKHHIISQWYRHFVVIMFLMIPQIFPKENIGAKILKHFFFAFTISFWFSLSHNLFASFYRSSKSQYVLLNAFKALKTELVYCDLFFWWKIATNHRIAFSLSCFLLPQFFIWSLGLPKTISSYCFFLLVWFDSVNLFFHLRDSTYIRETSQSNNLVQISWMFSWFVRSYRYVCISRRREKMRLQNGYRFLQQRKKTNSFSFLDSQSSSSMREKSYLSSLVVMCMCVWMPTVWMQTVLMSLGRRKRFFAYFPSFSCLVEYINQRGRKKI